MWRGGQRSVINFLIQEFQNQNEDIITREIL